MLDSLREGSRRSSESQKSPNVREKPLERTEQCQKCETGSKVRGERTDRNKPFKKNYKPSSPTKSTVWQGESFWALLAFLKTKDKVTNAAREKYGSFKGAK